MRDADFRRRLEEMIRRARDRDTLVATQFLDPATQQEAVALCQARGCGCAHMGGYGEAERRMLFVLPDGVEESDVPIERYIACVRFAWRGGALRHGDFLGAAVSCGVQRACIGDIVFSKDSRESKESTAYLYATAQTASLIAGIDRVGRMPVTGAIVARDENMASRDSGESVTVNVAALRLDALIGVALHLARGKAAALIESGGVSVNWRQVLDKGMTLAEGDTISIRGFGRVKVAEIGGQSKKGRTFARLEIWGN